jgi:DNA mismatch repair protein MutS
VEVKDSGDRVLFLHRLVPGGSNRSYGIVVGRLAGLPIAVLERARKLLALFEGEQIVSALGSARKGATDGSGRPASGGKTAYKDQLGLFAPQHPIVDELKQLNPDAMTPLEALTLVTRLVGRARQG